MQFIPMALVLLYASFPRAFSEVSHSIIGKLFAVCLVLYYTRIYYIFGLVAVIAVIVYYQDFDIQENFEQVEPAKKKEVKKEEGFEEDGTNLNHEQESDTQESFSPLADNVGVISIDHFNTAKDAFIKEKCKNGVLMYKMMPVRNEMSDHVYSEIKFNTDTKCNPCDSKCDYNIIEAKLKTEESLRTRATKL